MTRRQTAPEQWFIIDSGRRKYPLQTVRGLPRGSGILVLRKLDLIELRQLRHLAQLRGLVLVNEAAGEAARIHSMKELRDALRKRIPFLLISPIYKTKSHPDWPPLPRMRAAALARLAKRRAIALGGMNETLFSRVRPLGFIGWAGISAFRT